VTLPFLGAAFALAIANRGDVQRHARWMATTLLIVLPPGLTRLMFVLFDTIPMSRVLALAYAMLIAACGVLVLVDWRGGRERPVRCCPTGLLASEAFAMQTPACQHRGTRGPFSAGPGRVPGLARGVSLPLST
jgi:hypothetical protein